MSFDPNETPNPGARIKVIGVGGGGTNAVSTMIQARIEGVDFVCANTDIQSLRASPSPHKIQLGKQLTKGLGAGADPDIGRDAALEDRHEIHEAISGADMVFITAGMGGGTGTGGASVVAQIARDSGALTVAVVTTPFQFEGKRRKRHAEIGIDRLRDCVDTLIVIPNQRLLQVVSPDLGMKESLKLADNVLANAVRGISDIINIPGMVNVDFADVKTIMSSMGQALMGIGTASGENRAVEAARKAIQSPLLENIDIEGATGILINVTAGENLSLIELNEACSIIQEAAHEEANIIFGTVLDDAMEDEVRVTVIATGFPSDRSESNSPSTTLSSFSSLGKKQRPTSSFASSQELRQNTYHNIVNENRSTSAKPPSVNADPFPTATQSAFHAEHKSPREESPAHGQNIDDLSRLTLKTLGLEEARTTALKREAASAGGPALDLSKMRQQGKEESRSAATPSPWERAQGRGEERRLSTTGKDLLIQDIDHSIDQTLELTEKIKALELDGEDDLDIPSFLRSPTQQISLSDKR